MEEKDFYQLLVQRYIQNKATEDELKVFFQLLKEGKLDAYICDAMNAATFTNDPMEAIPVVSKRKILTRGRIVVAAIVLLVFSIGTYIEFRKNKQQPETARLQIQLKNTKDIAPGSDKAVLILADGSKIALDGEHNGVLAQQGNTKVMKLDGGLAYNAPSIRGSQVETFYNMIVTPRGGQYQLVLSDGSKVWLNAASSLRFPTTFTGKERRVELTGEGYFEVAHNAQMPFVVQKGTTSIKVLGTHFNVKAYDDEQDTKVTLLQGSVRVSKGNEAALLQPGQQALLFNAPSGDGSIEVQTNADVNEAIAWKNGVFQFEGADIQEVMRQIARWYDVEVVYKGQVDQHFRGTISRTVAVSKILKMLELTGAVHFTIADKKIIVSP